MAKLRTEPPAAPPVVATAEQFYNRKYMTLENAPHFGTEHFLFAESYADFKGAALRGEIARLTQAVEDERSVWVEANKDRERFRVKFAQTDMKLTGAEYEIARLKAELARLTNEQNSNQEAQERK